MVAVNAIVRLPHPKGWRLAFLVATPWEASQWEASQWEASQWEATQRASEAGNWLDGWPKRRPLRRSVQSSRAQA